MIVWYRLCAWSGPQCWGEPEEAQRYFVLASPLNVPVPKSGCNGWYLKGSNVCWWNFKFTIAVFAKTLRAPSWLPPGAIDKRLRIAACHCGVFLRLRVWREDITLFLGYYLSKYKKNHESRSLWHFIGTPQTLKLHLIVEDTSDHAYMEIGFKDVE